MPSRFRASWRAEPAAFSNSPSTSATATKPAAGTVVTEIKTPVKAADRRLMTGKPKSERGFCEAGPRLARVLRRFVREVTGPAGSA